MPLKYIENRTLRVELPTGELRMVRVPLSKTISDLIVELGYDPAKYMVTQKNPLPSDSKVTVVRERDIKLVKGVPNGMGGRESKTKGLHRHSIRQQKRS